MASKNKAFTLVELLVVIAIIGILAGFVYTGVENAIEKAKVTKTRATIDDLAIALTSFERDMGSFDVRAGNEQFPTGELKTDADRIKLVKMLSGKQMNTDGTFQIVREIREEARWNGPYFDPKPDQLQPKTGGRVGQLVDAWKNPILIRIKQGDYDRMMKFRPDSFEIWSPGPNEINEITLMAKGKNADDVTNWE